MLHWGVQGLREILCVAVMGLGKAQSLGDTMKALGKKQRRKKLEQTEIMWYNTEQTLTKIRAGSCVKMSEEETEKAHLNDTAVQSTSSSSRFLNKETRLPHNLWCYKCTVMVVNAGPRRKVKEFPKQSASNKDSLTFFFLVRVSFGNVEE